MNRTNLNKTEQQIMHVSSLPFLPLKIEESESEFQAIVVKSEKKMYIFLCGNLIHIISNLPKFNVDRMSDLFLKACSLTKYYYNISANYKFVINQYNLMMEGCL